MTAAAPVSGLPIATGAQSARVFARALGSSRSQLAGVILILVVGAAAGMVTPAVLGSIVGSVSDGSATAGHIWRLGALIAVAAILAAALTGLGMVLSARVFESALAHVRERLVTQALALPPSVIERAGTGDLISRASDDVAQVSNAVPQVIPALSGALFTIVVTFAGMAVLDLRYALALALILPVHVLTLRWYLRVAPPIYAAERAAMAMRAHHVLASLQGIDTVLAYRLGAAHSAKMARASWDVVTWSMRARIVQNQFFGRLNFAEFIGMGAILVTGFALIDAGLSTIGAATTAMLFFLRLFDPINQLLFVVDSLQSAAASMNRIVGVIVFAEQRMDVPDSAPVVTGFAATGTTPVVRIQRATFAYDPGHRVLHGIDLSIAHREKVAVVGASGAGKTTLGALVAGLHEPNSGTIHRNHAGAALLVTQEVHVFTGTVRDNLTLVRAGACDDEVIGALGAVAAEDLLGALPNGLDTVVGMHGHRLTPAQAQHLALARIMLADPELVVLDEATAEAGSASAELLDRATGLALHGRTALIIAHRLSQAATADRILVMDAGRIVEQGTHRELLATGGRYSTLWSAWAR